MGRLKPPKRCVECNKYHTKLGKVCSNKCRDKYRQRYRKKPKGRFSLMKWRFKQEIKGLEIKELVDKIKILYQRRNFTEYKIKEITNILEEKKVLIKNFISEEEKCLLKTA